MIDLRKVLHQSKNFPLTMATMKIPGKPACLLACLVVVGAGYPRAISAGTPEEWSHWISWSDPMLDEAMYSATEAGHHHVAFWDQSQHPTGALTSLPDHPPQAASQSTHPAGDMRATTPWESLEAIEDFLINQPNADQGTVRSEYYNASPTTGRPRGSSPALPITQLSAGPQLDLIPFYSVIQSDHRQPQLDMASEPPTSQGRPRKRKNRPQRELDEPTHPVVGSIPGSEILLAEPSQALPPQAPITFDASLFQLADVADVAPDIQHLQQMQIDAIRKVIEACPSKLLVIPEEEFLEYSQSYNSYLHKQAATTKNRPKESNIINHTKKARKPINRESNRKLRLRGKLKEFNKHVDFWYHRWFANTGTHFQINPNLAHYEFLPPHRCVILHSLYLFYVEMISSIVPRTSQNANLASELISAHEAFERLSKAANKHWQAASRGDEQSFNNPSVKVSVGEEANKLLNVAAKKVKDQTAVDEFFEIFPPLWTYLGFWMDTNRPGIFKHPTKIARELPGASKGFLNAIFLHSYTALYKRLSSL